MLNEAVSEVPSNLFPIHKIGSIAQNPNEIGGTLCICFGNYDHLAIISLEDDYMMIAGFVK